MIERVHYWIVFKEVRRPLTNLISFTSFKELSKLMVDAMDGTSSMKCQLFIGQV